MNHDPAFDLPGRRTRWAIRAIVAVALAMFLGGLGSLTAPALEAGADPIDARKDPHPCVVRPYNLGHPPGDEHCFDDVVGVASGWLGHAAASFGEQGPAIDEAVRKARRWPVDDPTNSSEIASSPSDSAEGPRLVSSDSWQGQ